MPQENTAHFSGKYSTLTESMENKVHFKLLILSGFIK